MTASPKGRIFMVRRLGDMTLFDASFWLLAHRIEGLWSGLRLQGTPSPPPKTHHQNKSEQTEAYKSYTAIVNVDYRVIVFSCCGISLANAVVDVDFSGKYLSKFFYLLYLGDTWWLMLRLLFLRNCMRL